MSNSCSVWLEPLSTLPSKPSVKPSTFRTPGACRRMVGAVYKTSAACPSCQPTVSHTGSAPAAITGCGLNSCSPHHCGAGTAEARRIRASLRLSRSRRICCRWSSRLRAAAACCADRSASARRAAAEACELQGKRMETVRDMVRPTWTAQQDAQCTASHHTPGQQTQLNKPTPQCMPPYLASVARRTAAARKASRPRPRRAQLQHYVICAANHAALSGPSSCRGGGGAAAAACQRNHGLAQLQKVGLQLWSMVWRQAERIRRCAMWRHTLRPQQLLEVLHPPPPTCALRASVAASASRSACEQQLAARLLRYLPSLAVRMHAAAG